MSKEKDQVNSTKDTKSIDNYIDDYVIKPKYDDPTFKALMKAFEQQEHRFEIDTCEFKYNGKSFFLGDSTEAIEVIFGEADKERFYNLDKSKYFLDYASLEAGMEFSSESDQLLSFKLNTKINNYKTNSKFNIVIFRSLPYKKGVELNDFMSLSNLNYDHLNRTRFTFYLVDKACNSEVPLTIYTELNARPIYENSGVGHLNWSDNFDPKKSNQINSFFVGYKDKK